MNQFTSNPWAGLIVLALLVFIIEANISLWQRFRNRGKNPGAGWVAVFRPPRAVNQTDAEQMAELHRRVQQLRGETPAPPEAEGSGDQQDGQS